MLSDKAAPTSLNDLPMADARSDDRTRKQIRAAVSARNLASASNNTRWNELISHFRSLDGWRPSYRSKSVTGFVSDWDAEWFCHLPFPFESVEWFDIGLYEEGPFVGRLLPRIPIDHSGEVLPVLERIGFDFEKREDIVRIWGYLPRAYEDFPLLRLGSSCWDGLGTNKWPNSLNADTLARRLTQAC